MQIEIENRKKIDVGKALINLFFKVFLIIKQSRSITLCVAVADCPVDYTFIDQLQYCRVPHGRCGCR